MRQAAPRHPLAATLEAMHRLREDGKVAHLGVSNVPPALLRAALREAPILTDQVEYHPLRVQDRLLAVCRQDDVVLTAYSPLARGRLPAEVAVQEIAESHGRTPAQVALRWLVQQDRVVAIPKSASPERRQQNLGIFDFALTPVEMARIGALGRGDRYVDPDSAPDPEE